jgi:hypothetical protein
VNGKLEIRNWKLAMDAEEYADSKGPNGFVSQKGLLILLHYIMMLL